MQITGIPENPRLTIRHKGFIINKAHEISPGEPVCRILRKVNYLMKLYLMRHGQTEGNAGNRVQGWTDVPLTAKGRKQAKTLGERVAGRHFDRIYGSDIFRARQTEALVFGENAEIVYDERLREINNTVLAGRGRPDLIAEYGEVYENCTLNFDYSPLGGESADSLLARTASFIADMEKLPEKAEIAALTHGGTIRAILSNVLNMPLRSRTLEIDNCSVTVLRFTKGRWLLVHFNNLSEF